MQNVDVANATQIQEAQRAIQGIRWPPEVKRLSVTPGPDATGSDAPWIHIFVSEDATINKDLVNRITSFTRELQSAVFDAGVTLFPYTSLEQEG